MESRDPMSAIVRNLNPYKRVQGTRLVEHFFSGCCRLGCPQGRRQTLLRLCRPQSVRFTAGGPRHVDSEWPRQGRALGPSHNKGLQESICAFETLDTEVGPEPILEKAAPRPLLDPSYSGRNRGPFTGHCGWAKCCTRAHF
jgi:hypothetical protein